MPIYFKGDRISIFEDYLPALSVVVNGIYWTEKYPRLITNAALKSMMEAERHPKLELIGDITCDIEGSIQCTKRATQPDNPVYTYDPFTDSITDGFGSRGFSVLPVDNFPCELPAESSSCFGDILISYIPEMVKTDYHAPYKKLALSGPVKTSLILQEGEFTPPFTYMKAYIK